jgi:hypothetical protein
VRFYAPALYRTDTVASLETSHHGPYKCLYCRQDLVPLATITNKNRNLRCRYILCTAWPEGEFRPGAMSHQWYFCWVDRMPSPPSAITSLLSPPSTAPPLSALPVLTPPIPFQVLPVMYCSFSGCKWKCVPACDCERKMCRTHCQLNGGCQCKDHVSKASSKDIPQALPPVPLSLPSPNIDDSLIDSSL